MAGKPKSPKDQFAAAKKGVSKDDAMKGYVALVAKLEKAQG
jgi:acyl-CoA-binding protein